MRVHVCALEFLLHPLFPPISLGVEADRRWPALHGTRCNAHCKLTVLTPQTHVQWRQLEDVQALLEQLGQVAAGPSVMSPQGATPLADKLGGLGVAQDKVSRACLVSSVTH